MKDLLFHIVSNLVINTEAIDITTEEKDRDITFFLKVDKDDMGRVIGKKGRIANSIRTIARACKNDSGKNIFVEIVD